MRASLEKGYIFGMEFSIHTKVGKIGLSRCTNGSSITVADVVLCYSKVHMLIHIVYNVGCSKS
jgi:hypothetical protein